MEYMFWDNLYVPPKLKGKGFRVERKIETSKGCKYKIARGCIETSEQMTHFSAQPSVLPYLGYTYICSVHTKFNFDRRSFVDSFHNVH